MGRAHDNRLSPRNKGTVQGHGSPSRALRRLRCVLACLLFCLLMPLGGEELWSRAGFFIDLPEGFSLVEGDGKSRFSFVDPAGGMEFDLIAYDSARYAGVDALASAVLGKLNSAGEREPFSYEGRDALFAELAFPLNGQKKRGFGIFIAARRAAEGSIGTPRNPGGGTEANRDGSGTEPERDIALLAYSDEARFESYADFILSCLDAFSADRAARRSPGPVSQYLLPFPPARTEEKTLRFGETLIKLPWDSEEATQIEDTAGREFRVLEAYGGTDELWKAAWARCYRMIYRESARRLDRLAIELDRLLPDDPTDAARELLKWVQEFHYERDQSGIDFVDPLSAAYEGRGDCDSRAMVLALILERRGIDVVLMLSRDYSHAMAGIDVPGGGQRFSWEGRDWLVAETTAKVGLGMIAANQADWKKWIAVSFEN